MNLRVVLLLLAPGPLAAQGLRLEAGVGVSTGTYLFEQRTTTWSLSTGAQVEAGRLTLRATLPFYFQNGTLVAGSAIGHLPTGGSSSGAVADSGQARHHRGGMQGTRSRPDLSHGAVEVPASATAEREFAVGDPVLGLGWRSSPGGATGLRLGAAVKVPVADTATFGTGEWDLGVSVGLSRRAGERWLLGLDLAYWRLGDMPDLELRDPVYGTASVGYLGRGGWGATLLASGGTAVLEGFDPPLSLGAGLTRISGAQAWSLLGTVGLTETSPDLTLGALWSVRLTR